MFRTILDYRFTTKKTYNLLYKVRGENMALNFSGGLQGGLGGAASGAALGSVFPGIGTLLGGGLGGILGGISGLFGGGSQGQFKQNPTGTPQQRNAMNLLLQQGSQQLQNPYQGFAPLAQQARTQFQNQTVPSLAERFSSLGNNSTSSPAFASQLGQAGAGLEEMLAALQAQYGLQNQQSALQLLSLGLSPAFENYYQQSQPGFGENLLSGSFQAAPSFLQSHQFSNALRSLQG